MNLSNNIIVLLCITTGFAQNNYNVAEGFYELSEFETAAGMYLLEDKTFFYFASFGNVDLKIYGKYTINKEKKLLLKPDLELNTEFHFYATNNGIQNDRITLIYNKPYNQRAEKLFVAFTDEKMAFPEFSNVNAETSLQFKKPKAKILKIGFSDAENNNTFKFENLETAKLMNGSNEILIFHNYYAAMVQAISKTPFYLDAGNLQNLNTVYPKIVSKKEISDAIKQEVRDFITHKRTEKPLIRNGKTYLKIN